jgi:hypothetical protein
MMTMRVAATSRRSILSLRAGRNGLNPTTRTLTVDGYRHLP